GSYYEVKYKSNLREDEVAKYANFQKLTMIVPDVMEIADIKELYSEIKFENLFEFLTSAVG
ncbi:MAG: hypothetical protein D6808_05230, partial [Candidatus Dadabacteria bacterium]